LSLAQYKTMLLALFHRLLIPTSWLLCLSTLVVPSLAAAAAKNRAFAEPHPEFHPTVGLTVGAVPETVFEQAEEKQRSHVL
jgi:hypothetical protein